MFRSSRPKAITAGVVAVVLLASGLGVASAAVSNVGALAVSLKADRSSPINLAGATLKGNAYVFLNRDKATSVSFYLDNATTAVAIELVAPYDLGTTASDGTAKPLDTTKLADGSHTVKAVMKNSVRTRTFTARFNVKNAVVAPGTTTTSTTAKPTTTTTAKPTTTTAKPTTTTVPTTGWPNASNTGVPAGVVLKPSGSIIASTPGQVIEGLDINGLVEIRAANVIIKNCKIHSDDYFGVEVESGNVTIMDSEFWGQNAAAIVFDNWVGIRLNIHDMPGDGVKMESNTTLRDSYIHDFKPGPGAHADGAQTSGAATNILIEHNYINPGEEGVNAALFMGPEDGGSAPGPIKINNNMLGGGGWTVYLGPKPGTTQGGWTFTNNHFINNWGYGPLTYNPGFTAVFSGNVVDATGAVVD